MALKKFQLALPTSLVLNFYAFFSIKGLSLGGGVFVTLTGPFYMSDDSIKDFDELLKVKGIVKTLEAVAAAKIQDRNELEAIRSNTVSQEPAHSLKQTM